MKSNIIWKLFIMVILLKHLSIPAVIANAKDLVPNGQSGKSILLDKKLSLNQNQSCTSCHEPKTGRNGTNSGSGSMVISDAKDLSPNEQLGKSIFFDEQLSINRNQSCGACHGSQAGWTGSNTNINAHGAVYEGSVLGRYGFRKPPSAAYATQSPTLYRDETGSWIGGHFFDGRATGKYLGSPAADQAQRPFLNPDEQALPDSACVAYRVCNPVNPDDYPVSFKDVWGDDVCDIDWPENIDDVCSTTGKTAALSPEDREKSNKVCDNIARSITAYEASSQVNAFTSKYDNTFKGKIKLTKQEQKGLSLFMGKGKCHFCHDGDKQNALFTFYGYDNLGIPKNPENPVYKEKPGFIDPGLGGFLKSAGYPENVFKKEYGKHKIPTLRNIDLRPSPEFVKTYGHNGFFKSLEGIVHFYNTRMVLPECPGAYTEAEARAANCWPAPEVSANLNMQLGNLGLSPEEEAAIVAFLKALSDG